MPSPARFLIVLSANRSSPTAVTMTTDAPSLAAATAWLAPLPPYPISKLGAFHGLALDRHALHIGHEVDHIAADHGDARLGRRAHPSLSPMLGAGEAALALSRQRWRRRGTGNPTPAPTSFSIRPPSW